MKEKQQSNGRFRIQSWYLFLIGFLLWFFLLFFYHSGGKITTNDLQHIDSVSSPHLLVKSYEESGLLPIKSDVSVITKTEDFAEPGNNDDFFIGGDWKNIIDELKEDTKLPINDASDGQNSKLVDDSCKGRYIYVHEIPTRFNLDLLRDCKSLRQWTDMCSLTLNSGLGPHIPGPRGWFSTDQFMLEVIFHNRMKQYKCLTNDSSLASAIFVPYYTGLDVARYLWNFNASIIDRNAIDLVKWLREKPEWNKMNGRDHFLIAGRITWDFRRLSDEKSQWGSKLLFMPESRNMTVLVIESSPWHSNDVAIPYPTYFHPSSDIEVIQWQSKMRRQKRKFMFSFAGGSRPNISSSIRGEIIDQCKSTRRKCKLLECVTGSNKCYKPINVMRMFQNSIFCLQPPGDSYTRRSAFDSILAGCIPVFFHPGSAYVQYFWHLPKDYTKYSVFIPENKVKEGKVSIERILSKIPKQKMLAMREEVIRLIPRVTYADSRGKLETVEDAFDVTIKGVVRRIETARRDMREGKSVSYEVQEEMSWKYNLNGRYDEHEWDPFFSRT